MRKRAKFLVGIHVGESRMDGVLLRGGRRAEKPLRRLAREWARGADIPLESFLSELVPEAKLRNLAVAFLLDRVQFAFERRTFPFMDPSDFLRATRWYGENNRRTDLENPHFSAWHQPGAPTGERHEAIDSLLLETDGDEVDRLLEAVTRAGIKKYGLIPAPLAWQSFLPSRLEEDHVDTAVIVELGRESGNLTVYEGNRLVIHREVDLAPDPFDLSKDELAISLTPVDETVATAVLTKPEPAVSTSKLVTELQRTAHYVESRYSIVPEAVYLTGPDPELTEALSHSLGWKTGTLLTGQEALVSWGEPFAACVGSAMRLGSGESVGLIPDRAPRTRLMRELNRQRNWLVNGALRGLLGALLVLLLIQLGSYIGTRNRDQLSDRVARLTESYELPELEARLTEWERSALTLNHFRSMQFLWSEVFRSVGTGVPDRLSLSLVSGEVPGLSEMDLEAVDPLAIPDPLADVWDDEWEEEEASVPWMTLQGTSVSMHPIRELIRSLEKSPPFRQVILESAEYDEDKSDGTLLFLVRCRPAVDRTTWRERESGDD